MDLDTLKNTWNQEKIDELPEISLEKQNDVHSPLDKIRKNMRMEFWTTGLMMIGFFPFFFLVKDNFKGETQIMFLIFWLTFLFVVFYYLYKFYLFYKKIPSSFPTFNLLMDLHFNLKLNSELYKSYYISTVPIILAEFIIIYYVMKPNEGNDMFGFIIFFTLTVLLLLLFGRLWFNYYYGKHIRKIDKVLNELK